MTTHIWDGQNMAAELSGTGLKANYLRGANLLASEDSAGARSYYLYNAHGDVVQLSNASGTVTKSYDYDAFGNQRGAADNADANPFRYCGEYHDTETGTVYLRARYYDPVVGRFTQRDTHWNTTNMIYGDHPEKFNEREADPNDPLALNTYTYVPDVTAIMQSGNLYVYGINNPIMNLDPSGLWTLSLGISANVTAFLGASEGLSLVIDDQGMVGIQRSYSRPAEHVGVLDIGVAGTAQFTFAENISDLENDSVMMGPASFSYFGADVIMIAGDGEKVTPDMLPSGAQIQYGKGLGFDIHIMRTYTETLVAMHYTEVPDYIKGVISSVWPW